MIKLSKAEADKLGLRESPIGRKWEAQAMKGPKVRKRGRQQHQQLVNSCIEYLRIKGIECAEFKQGAMCYDGRWVKFGKSPGWPDIVACKLEWQTAGVPVGFRVGQFIGIECKIGRDRQNPDQIAAQKRIEAAGGRYYVIKSIVELEKLFP